MAEIKSGINQGTFQKQQQKQGFVLSQKQLQAVRMLSMSSGELKEEILKEIQENPALEIVPGSMKNGGRNPSQEEYSYSSGQSGETKAENYQKMLENQESGGETLQQHLLAQINMLNLSSDEYSLSQKLIYNLDKNGFYGSMLSPETFLDKKRPLQNKAMLERCIKRLQLMDPVGTCCKTPEESLLVQAKAKNAAPPLSLFILDGNLQLLNPPEPEKVLKNLIAYKNRENKKAFASPIALDSIPLNLETVSETIDFILGLNVRPAFEYQVEEGHLIQELPDVVLEITLEKGSIPADDFDRGLVYLDAGHYFQVAYSRGELPELRISKEMDFNSQAVARAKDFIESLKFRESTILLQGCAIVKHQKKFFIKGPGHILPLTQAQIARELNIHPSTVSRMAGKKSSKYFQTQWGAFPAGYFFSSGVSSERNGEKISAEAIKTVMQKLIQKSEAENVRLSDQKLTELLNEKGIKIARRTVAKYRQAIGINNSYSRE